MDIIRCEQKEKIIDEVKRTENWDLLDKIEKVLEEPVYIRDFIRDLLKRNYGHFGCGGEIGEMYYDEKIVKLFEMSIRLIWIEIGNNLVPICKHIDHWSELYVEKRLNCKTEKTYREDLDIWISENGYLFDSRELSWVIFNIWCGKVTFEK